MRAVDAGQAPLLRPRLGASPGALLPWAAGAGVIFTAIRAYAMLGPLSARPLFLAHCVLMALTPWLLLTPSGRMESGIQKPRRPLSLAIAPPVGAAAALLCFTLGYMLFAQTADNWFVSVGNSFRAQPTADFSIVQLHLMFTIPAIIFSPLGEEIYFRGVLQRALETRVSPRASTLIESAWFGAAHLVHHGLFLTAAGLAFRPVSGALWFALMTLLSLAFAALRKFGDSVLPSVLAHAVFNATMNYFILSYLWNHAA